MIYAMVPGGSFNVLLGTFRGPSNAVAAVALEDCNLECGGTSALVLAALLPLAALRTARRRLA